MLAAVLLSVVIDLPSAGAPQGTAAVPGLQPGADAPYPDSLVAEVSVGNDPRDLCYDPSQDRIFLAIGYGYVPVIDAVDHSLLAFVSVGESPSDVCVTPAGDLVYVSDDEESVVRVIDTSSYTVTDEIAVPSPASAIEALPGGEEVVVLHLDGQMSIIDVPENTVQTTFWVANSPGGFCVSPDGSAMFVSDRNSASATEVALPGFGTTSFFVGGDTFDACVLQSSDFIYLNVREWEMVSVLTLPDFSPVADVSDVGESPNLMCSVPPGDYVYITDDALNAVTVLRTSDNLLVDTLQVSGDPEGICASPSGDFVYVANSGSNTMSILGLSTTGIGGGIEYGTLSASIRPNPACGPAELVVETSSPGDLQVDIYRLDGRLASTVESRGLTEGVHGMALSDLPPGAYLVRVAMGSVSVVRKLLVLE